MTDIPHVALEGGARMPLLGLGTWKSEGDDAYHAVKEAIAVGYRHIDGAWIYGNEDQVGRAIRESIEAGITTRDALFITTKLWNCFHRPEQAEGAIEESLTKLGLDYVDLYLMHWPIGFQSGERFPKGPEGFLPLSEVPLEATFEAMRELTAKGLARTVGVSNFSASKLDRIVDKTGSAPAVNQVELHPFLAQPALVAHGAKIGTHHTAYSPLGSRDRPASMKREDEVGLLDHETVVEVAEGEGITPGQLLIAWAISRGTSVIPKSANPGRIRENFEAGAHALSAEAKAALDGLDRGARYVDPQSMMVRGVNYEGASFWE